MKDLRICRCTSVRGISTSYSKLLISPGYSSLASNCGANSHWQVLAHRTLRMLTSLYSFLVFLPVYCTRGHNAYIIRIYSLVRRSLPCSSRPSPRFPPTIVGDVVRSPMSLSASFSDLRFGVASGVYKELGRRVGRPITLSLQRPRTFYLPNYNLEQTCLTWAANRSLTRLEPRSR